MAKLGDATVGGIVKLNVNSTALDFIIVNQGNPDSSVYDSSCDGTWLLMKDLYQEMYFTSGTTNVYPSSDIHSYLNNTFLNLLDSDIKGNVKTVKLPYAINNMIQSGTNGFSAKCFILSMAELGATSYKWVVSGEGVALEYFAPNTNDLRIAYPINSSEADSYWTRSPRKNKSDEGTHIYKKGTTSTGATCGEYATVNYIRPAIILPSDMAIDDSGFVTVGSSFAGNQNFSGVWEEMDSVWECYNGVWTELVEGYENIGGVWQETN